MRSIKLWIVLLLFVSAPVIARAEVGLLMEQPIGMAGRWSGTGHVAIYLSRVCAAAPNKLRRCRPGEAGVVITRCKNADRFDWTAVPLLPYLFAVERPEDIPVTIDDATEIHLRERYRRQHFEGIISDVDSEDQHGHWTQLMGSAYDRRIYVFETKTTAAQDDLLIQKLNAGSDKARFNIWFHNCANFSQSVLNFYYPHAIHRSFTADVGLMTPKQTAKSFVSYARKHPDLQFSAFVIPQVPGKIERSGQTYGVVEAFLKKKYVIPLAVWQPYIALALVGTYFTRGRFNPNQHVVVLHRDEVVAALVRDEAPPQGLRLRPSLETVSIASERRAQSTNCLESDCGGPAAVAAPEEVNMR